MSRRPARRASPRPAPPVEVLDLVAITDGPMRGHWYTTADWDARLESARGMAARGQQRSVCLSYAPTGAQVPHPVEDAWVGQEWAVAR